MEKLCFAMPSWGCVNIFNIITRTDSDLGKRKMKKEWVNKIEIKSFVILNILFDSFHILREGFFKHYPIITWWSYASYVSRSLSKPIAVSTAARHAIMLTIMTDTYNHRTSSCKDQVRPFRFFYCLEQFFQKTRNGKSMSVFKVLHHSS